MFQRRGGIQRKIVIAMLVVGLLPGLAGIYFTYLSGTEALKDSIGANFRAIARKTAEKIDIIVNEKILDARALSLSSLIESAAKESNRRDPANKNPLTGEVYNYINRYQREWTEDIISITVVDKEGRVIASTSGNSPPQSPQDKGWTDILTGKKGAFVGDVTFDSLAQVYSMLIAVPILEEKTREIIGGVKVVFNIKDIFGSIMNVEIGESGHANLVASDGTLLVCPIFPPQSHAIHSGLLKQVAVIQPGWEIAPDDGHGGKNSIIGFSPVKTTLQMGKENFGGKGWYVFISQRPEETYSAIYSLLWRVSILGLTLVSLLSLLGYFVARRIVRPIRMLSEGANRIGKGHLDHDLKITTGDEIEELSDILNQMAKDLEKRFQEIRLERDKLNTVMDNLGDGLLILDQDFKIVYMNAEVLRLYGKEAIGKPYYEVLRIGDRGCEKCSQRMGYPMEPHTHEVVTDEGRTYIVNHSTIRNIEGTIAFVHVYKDITERKRLEQQLLYSERLTALGLLSSTFAHDLRNPVIAIKKTITMLKNSYNSLPEEVVKNVYSDLISTCGLLLGLVNDVLDIHQVSYRELPLLYSSFSLNQALEEVVKLLKIEAEDRKIRVVIEKGDHDIWIEGDKRRIQRVFINLLSNALKYSPPDGCVNISLNSHQNLGASSGVSDMLFKIEDEGPGIPQSDLSRIFDLFYRTDESGIKSGIGLGLYLCKIVVEAHGGKIWAENRKEGGAAFYIEMPLVRRDVDAYQDSLS